MNFKDLTAAYLGGELDEAGRDRLAAILRNHPAARAAFAAALRQEVLLTEIFREAVAQRRPAKPLVPRLALSAAAALLLAALAGILLSRAGPAPPPAVLERIEGTVWIFQPTGRSRATVGGPIPPGDTIETEGPASAAEARLEDGSRLRLSEAARASISEGRIFLERGHLDAEIRPRPAGRPFVIGTPQAELYILGTRLTVSTGEDLSVLRVEEGRVLMKRRSDAASAEVSAGHYAVAAPGIPLEARPLPPAGPRAGGPIVRILSHGRRELRRPSVYRLAEGCLFYGDRGYVLTTVPPELRGHWGIITFAEDRNSEEPELLSFEVHEPVDVFVGYDRRALKPVSRLPTWMEPFQDTGLRIFSRTAGDSTYHVFRRRFPPGKITLGGNHHGGDTGAGVNYLVVVAPAGAVRTVERQERNP